VLNCPKPGRMTSPSMCEPVLRGYHESNRSGGKRNEVRIREKTGREA
jgi:hypothetical protein